MNNSRHTNVSKEYKIRDSYESEVFYEKMYYHFLPFEHRVIDIPLEPYGDVSYMAFQVDILHIDPQNPHGISLKDQTILCKHSLENSLVDISDIISCSSSLPPHHELFHNVFPPSEAGEDNDLWIPVSDISSFSQLDHILSSYSPPPSEYNHPYLNSQMLSTSFHTSTNPIHSEKDISSLKSENVSSLIFKVPSHLRNRDHVNLRLRDSSLPRCRDSNASISSASSLAPIPINLSFDSEDELAEGGVVVNEMNVEHFDDHSSYGESKTDTNIYPTSSLRIPQNNLKPRNINFFPPSNLLSGSGSKSINTQYSITDHEHLNQYTHSSTFKKEISGKFRMSEQNLPDSLPYSPTDVVCVSQSSPVFSPPPASISFETEPPFIKLQTKLDAIVENNAEVPLPYDHQFRPTFSDPDEAAVYSHYHEPQFPSDFNTISSIPFSRLVPPKDTYMGTLSTIESESETTPLSPRSPYAVLSPLPLPSFQSDNPLMSNHINNPMVYNTLKLNHPTPPQTPTGSSSFQIRSSDTDTDKNMTSSYANYDYDGGDTYLYNRDEEHYPVVACASNDQFHLEFNLFYPTPRSESSKDSIYDSNSTGEFIENQLSSNQRTTIFGPEMNDDPVDFSPDTSYDFASSGASVDKHTNPSKNSVLDLRIFLPSVREPRPSYVSGNFGKFSRQKKLEVPDVSPSTSLHSYDHVTCNDTSHDHDTSGDTYTTNVTSQSQSINSSSSSKYIPFQSTYSDNRNVHVSRLCLKTNTSLSLPQTSLNPSNKSPTTPDQPINTLLIIHPHHSPVYPSIIPSTTEPTEDRAGFSSCHLTPFTDNDVSFNTTPTTDGVTDGLTVTDQSHSTSMSSSPFFDIPIHSLRLHTTNTSPPCITPHIPPHCVDSSLISPSLTSPPALSSNNSVLSPSASSSNPTSSLYKSDLPTTHSVQEPHSSHYPTSSPSDPSTYRLDSLPDSSQSQIATRHKYTKSSISVNTNHRSNISSLRSGGYRTLPKKIQLHCEKNDHTHSHNHSHNHSHTPTHIHTTGQSTTLNPINCNEHENTNDSQSIAPKDESDLHTYNPPDSTVVDTDVSRPKYFLAEEINQLRNQTRQLTSNRFNSYNDNSRLAKLRGRIPLNPALKNSDKPTTNAVHEKSSHTRQSSMALERLSNNNILSSLMNHTIDLTYSANSTPCDPGNSISVGAISIESDEIFSTHTPILPYKYPQLLNRMNPSTLRIAPGINSLQFDDSQIIDIRSSNSSSIYHSSERSSNNFLCETESNSSNVYKDKDNKDLFRPTGIYSESQTRVNSNITFDKMSQLYTNMTDSTKDSNNPSNIVPLQTRLSYPNVEGYSNHSEYPIPVQNSMVEKPFRKSADSPINSSILPMGETSTTSNTLYYPSNLDNHLTENHFSLPPGSPDISKSKPEADYQFTVPALSLKYMPHNLAYVPADAMSITSTLSTRQSEFSTTSDFHPRLKKRCDSRTRPFLPDFWRTNLVENRETKPIINHRMSSRSQSIFPNANNETTVNMRYNNSLVNNSLVTNYNYPPNHSSRKTNRTTSRNINNLFVKKNPNNDSNRKPVPESIQPVIQLTNSPLIDSSDPVDQPTFQSQSGSMTDHMNKSQTLPMESLSSNQTVNSVGKTSCYPDANPNSYHSGQTLNSYKSLQTHVQGVEQPSKFYRDYLPDKGLDFYSSNAEDASYIITSDSPFFSNPTFTSEGPLYSSYTLNNVPHEYGSGISESNERLKNLNNLTTTGSSTNTTNINSVPEPTLSEVSLNSSRPLSGSSRLSNTTLSIAASIEALERMQL